MLSILSPKKRKSENLISVLFHERVSNKGLALFTK